MRTLTEGTDPTSAGGRLGFSFFAAVAEFERALIVERTNTGLKAARERGRVGGRPRAMDAGKQDAARRLIQAGRPMTEVAKTLGVSRSTLYRWVG